MSRLKEMIDPNKFQAIVSLLGARVAQHRSSIEARDLLIMAGIDFAIAEEARLEYEFRLREYNLYED